jgi:hypothetical protein
VDDVVTPFLLSGTGVALAALAFYNRKKPAWQRDMPRLMILALGQVALGFVSWLLIALSN